MINGFIEHFWQHQLPTTVFPLEISADVPNCKPIQRATVQRTNDHSSSFPERVAQVLGLLLFTLPRSRERRVWAEGWKGETARKNRTFPISSVHS